MFRDNAIVCMGSSFCLERGVVGIGGIRENPVSV